MALVVTSWNLQGSAGPDIEAVADHLRRVGCDVALVQEVQRRQARGLARTLGARSCSWGFKHWPVRTRPEGMAILGISRSVQGTDTVGLTARWRIWSWRRRIVQFAHLDGLRLINIHLSPQDVESLREHELARVLHRAARDRSNARLMAGDFNARPNAALFAALTAAGLRDAWVVARPDSANAGATHWSARDRGRRAPTRRIDYVWVSPDITIERADLPRYGSDGYEIYPKLSDHLPLTVTLDVE